MPKISTGFRVKPLVGAVDAEQRLARYLPMPRFRQLLEKKALWFTRVMRWKDNDACEAALLPAYRAALRSSFKSKDDDEYLHIKALMEFQLRAALGCCFSMFDGAENDLMWRSYAPSANYGVILVVRAHTIHEAVVTHSAAQPLFARVKYLTDEKAQGMRVEHCPHFRVKDGLKSWDVSECAFFKRQAFEGEREVRCVIRATESWTALLEKFLRGEGIPKLMPGAPPPSPAPHVRIDLRDSLEIIMPRDRVVYISIPQMRKLTSVIESGCEAYLDASTSPATSVGLYVPIDLGIIEEIVIHPKLSATGGAGKDMLMSAIAEAGLRCSVRPSALYSTAW